MSKNTQFILIFLGSGTLMFLIFFFYPAEVFDVKLIGNTAESSDEVSMRTFLGFNTEFNSKMAATNLEVKRKLSGWLVIFIALVGLPLMIAYRSIITKPNKEEQED